MNLYNIALSGLNSAQLALGSTSNNITNINTPGYNREVTQLAENRSSGGVKVVDIERQFNKFVAAQLNDANSTHASLTAYKGQIQQIDALLADSKSGLATMMQGFFSSLQSLAGAPSDPAARQGVIGSADNLTSQFRSMDAYLADLNNGVNGEVENQVIQINNIANQMAELNKQISLAKAKSGDAPNALLNQRDQLVADLSNRIGVKLNIQDNGTYNVSVGNGISLVAGNTSFQMTAIPDAANPTRTTVGYVDGGGNMIQLQETSIKGGELAGILEFRREALDSAQNRLGQLAVSLSMGFNAQHAAGVDFNGDAGDDFFTVGTPKIFSNERNTSASFLTAEFTDASQLGISDYDVSFTAATGYTVKKSGTNEVVGTFAPGSTELVFGGLTVSVNGAPAEGDRFLVKPLQYAAADFRNVISDVSLIAAGLPDGGTGSADNRNALALQGLQFKPLINGVSSLNQGYSALVNDVGNRSQIAKINEAAHSVLSEQLRGVQQSESGVNLDEEATNLLRYQQWYQASARVVETATTIVDTILNIKS